MGLWVLHLISAGSVLAMERIEWECEVCNQPIEEGDGFLWVDIDEADRVATAKEHWRREHTSGEGTLCTVDDPLDAPAEARWHQTHHACRPKDEIRGYEVDVGRIRTPWLLLTWTSHLLGKLWVYENSNWLGLVKDVAHAHGADVSTS